MSIEVLDEATNHPICFELHEVELLARHVLTTMHVHPRAELVVTFIDSDAMASLHEKWMNLPGPTDVMSFPMDELRPGSEDEPSDGVLGDVIVCPEVAARQAVVAGHAGVEELLLLVTHGILHLLGYDHVEPDDETEMFGLQRQLLLTFLAQQGREPSVTDWALPTASEPKDIP